MGTYCTRTCSSQQLAKKLDSQEDDELIGGSKGHRLCKQNRAASIVEHAHLLNVYPVCTGGLLLTETC